MVAGVTYKTAIWKHDWPIIMKNTLDACIAHGAKLVLFDNIYALDPAKVGHLTEKTPLNPQSEKGKVGKQILEMLWKEVKSGKLKAIVARAADFYGPGANQSVLNELVINRMKAGKNRNGCTPETKSIPSPIFLTQEKRLHFWPCRKAPGIKPGIFPQIHPIPAELKSPRS